MSSGEMTMHEAILGFQGALGRFMKQFGLQFERVDDDDCVYHPSSKLRVVAVHAREDGLQVQIGHDAHKLLLDGRFTNPESERDRIEMQDLLGRMLIHLQIPTTPGGNCA